MRVISLFRADTRARAFLFLDRARFALRARARADEQSAALFVDADFALRGGVDARGVVVFVAAVGVGVVRGVSFSRTRFLPAVSD